jgi:Domain of unknown function (DUF4281)
MLLNPDLVFKLANGAALLAWVALVFSPSAVSWAPTVRRITGRWLPLALAVVYLAMLAAHWRGQGGFGSIAEVRALFDVPGALVAGWVHYLAFDLFVGSWIAERAAALQMHHALLVPVLLLTFMFGPLGLLAFALLKPKVALS